MWAQQYTTSGTLFARMGARGNNLPCYPGGAGGYPYELDSFVEANGPNNAPGYPAAIIANVGLGTLSQLILSATVQPIYAAKFPGTICSTSFAKLVVSFTINNTSAHQTLFYQLGIFKANVSDSPAFYSNTNPFGYRDDMRNYGGVGNPGITALTPSVLSLDLLPQLKAVISNAANGMDTNVANWMTGAVYVGGIIYGGMSLIHEWSDISVVGVQ